MRTWKVTVTHPDFKNVKHYVLTKANSRREARKNVIRDHKEFRQLPLHECWVMTAHVYTQNRKNN